MTTFKGIFVGIHQSSTAYEIYLPVEDKFIASSHVFFNLPPQVSSSSPPLSVFLTQTLPKYIEDYQYRWFNPY
jgi:hypothetical protein